MTLLALRFVQAATNVDSVILGQWAIKMLGLLSIGSFTTGIAMLLKQTKIDTLLCDPNSGLLARFDRLEARVNVALGHSD